MSKLRSLYRIMTQPRSRFLIVKSVALISMVWAVYIYAVPLLKNHTIERSRKSQPSDDFIVPNIMHFIRYGSNRLSFIEAICILAALEHQAPEKLFFHTDQKDFKGGKYWDIMKTHKLAHVIEIKLLPPAIGLADEMTTGRMGANDSGEKLRILQAYGGIYVDNDNYIVRSLESFRRYEMTVLMDGQKRIFDHLIIANKNAKFLNEWLNIYKSEGDPWYYNQGAKKPEDILKKQPHLAHPLINWMGDTNQVTEQVYLESSDHWQAYYTIHLLINQQYLIPRNLSHKATYPVVFNETNINDYDVSIKSMVKRVYPPKT
uniref:Uncharacterized protein n=3 Tax=Lygus hesperus TaxID=30085 RepID=A0A0K8TDW6_LYGHE